ncbi:MAG: methyltransferase domain-containing protein [Candidatus Omnitrophica bacterium]|nr:methyltransferase domain-containing protein [Candidatus Omnitrophota bacterium]
MYIFQVVREKRSQVIKKKFSRVAPNYDRYADIQRYFGQMLLKELKKDGILTKKILDIGTGTGSLLKLLNSLYPKAEIVGVDMSWGMLEIAKEKIDKVLQADAVNLPLKNNSFDLVISNLALQWVIDLEAALFEVLRVLKREGRFYFTTFGPQTLKELKIIFPALEGYLKLNTLATIVDLLKKIGFLDIQSEAVLEKKTYPRMIDIVRWLKNIGANYTGYIPTKNLGMRRIWQLAEEMYRRQFSIEEGVFATFEVFLIKAQK